MHLDHRRKNDTITLAGGNTKTSEPRMLIMSGELFEVLRECISPHRTPTPIVRGSATTRGNGSSPFAPPGKTACVKLGLGKWTNPKAEIAGQRGYTGVLIHDFRRTAVKNLSDAGVPGKVATSISGHKTCSVFDRYNIVSVARLEEAGNLVVARHQALLMRLDPEA